MKRIWIAFLVGFVGSAITCGTVWAQATAQISGTEGYTDYPALQG